MVLNQIIDAIKREDLGYRMANKSLNILLFYAIDVLIEESEKCLQSLLFRSKRAAERYNAIISVEKTLSIVISKEPLLCKLVLQWNLLSW